MGLDKTINERIYKNDRYLLELIGSLTRQVNNNEEVVVQDASESEGNLTVKTVTYTTGPMSGPTWATLGFGLPGGVAILAAQANVVEAGAGGTWGCNFTGGSTTQLFPNNNLVALNTKAGKVFVPEVTTAATELNFTADSGSLNDLSVRVIVYYRELTDMADV